MENGQHANFNVELAKQRHIPLDEATHIKLAEQKYAYLSEKGRLDLLNANDLRMLTLASRRSTALLAQRQMEMAEKSRRKLRRIELPDQGIVKLADERHIELGETRRRKLAEQRYIEMAEQSCMEPVEQRRMQLDEQKRMELAEQGRIELAEQKRIKMAEQRHIDLDEQRRVKLAGHEVQQLYEQSVGQQKTNETNDTSNGLKPTAVYALNANDEEDSEIIESLSKAHPAFREIRVDELLDVVEDIEKSLAKSTSKSRGSSEIKEILPTGFNIDNDRADKEVSCITRLLETEINFIPVSRSEKKPLDPTASFVQSPLSRSEKKPLGPSASFVQPPPIVLPNVFNMSIPKRTLSNKNPILPEQYPPDILIPHFQPLREMSFSPNAQSHTLSVKDILQLNDTETLPVNGTDTLPMNVTETLPLNGTDTSLVNGNSKSNAKRADLLFGESGSDSILNLPNHWKYFTTKSPQKSESDEMDAILATYEFVEIDAVDAASS